MSVEMIAIWVAVGVVVAGAAVTGLLLWRRKGGDSLSRLVAEALGTEWAARLGTDAESVRAVVLRGEPAGVRDQLAALITDVEVGFELDGPGPAEAFVRCDYADSEAVTTVTLRLPWERVPQQVRDQYLRTGDKRASRHWSVPQPAPSPR
jgi:hypothetical protein